MELAMREYYRNKSNQRGYADFAKLVERNIDFFMNNFIEIVKRMDEGLEEMDFDGMEDVGLRLH